MDFASLRLSSLNSCLYCGIFRKASDTGSYAQRRLAGPPQRAAAETQPRTRQLPTGPPRLTPSASWHIIDLNPCPASSRRLADRLSRLPRRSCAICQARISQNCWPAGLARTGMSSSRCCRSEAGQSQGSSGVAENARKTAGNRQAGQRRVLQPVRYIFRALANPCKIAEDQAAFLQLA
jgi:hypothetical protein